MASSSEPVLHSRRSLYVGGLSNDVNESSLRAAMIPFGPIQSIEIVRPHLVLYSLTTSSI
jgi:RNA recognition motif-containing protein